MKIAIAVLATFALAGFARANQVDDDYASLKTAQSKKDADQVLKLAVTTAKEAKAEESTQQPADRVQFDKEVQTFSEYALATTAISAPPAKTIALVDALIALNPKSTYIGTCAESYLNALEKDGGAAKRLAGAQKVVAASPTNEDALYALATGSMSNPERAASYATKLVAALKSKAKPEGMTDADWERKKSLMMGEGYYIAGAGACAKQAWTDCDRDLRAAVPYVGKEPATAGPVYFYLGLANYQLGKLINDRARIQEALKYTRQSAAISGPMQAQAQRNASVMQQDLATPRR